MKEELFSKEQRMILKPKPDLTDKQAKEVKELILVLNEFTGAQRQYIIEWLNLFRG